MYTLRQSFANIVILSATVCCDPVRAEQPFFMGLGDLAGGTFSSSANGVSADGSVVVGSGNSASGAEAFRWTQAGGMIGLGDLAGGPFGSGASGVSADGSVVVGSSAVETVSSHGGPPFRTYYRAFRWTQSGGMVSLGLLSNANDKTSFGYAVSGNGLVAVGMSGVHPIMSALHGEAFRRTQGGAMAGLNVLPGYEYSDARDVSADGSVIVGRSWAGARVFVASEAFRWTQGSGMVGLGDLPGGSLNSRAYGVSSDGSVVVGYGSPAAGTEAFRWTQASGIVGLGILPGFSASVAEDVSADGSRVVGNSGFDYLNPREAFLWEATHGMRSLRDVLVSDFGLGASLAGWTLTAANAISADGQFIVGSGTNPDGNTEAWLARIPFAPTLPGDFNQDGTVDAADYVVWRKNPGGIYTQTDYNVWRAHFGQTAGSGAAGYPLGASTESLPATVPEPSSITLFAITTIWITARSRRPCGRTIRRRREVQHT